jgi:hypothetical protein
MQITLFLLFKSVFKACRGLFNVQWVEVRGERFIDIA